MSRDEVRAVLGSVFRYFEGGKIGQSFDQFIELGISAHYSVGKLIGAEFYRPGVAILMNIPLVSAPVREVVLLLENAGLSVIEERDGFLIDNGCVGLYVPDLGEGNEVVESVYIDMGLLPGSGLK